MTTVTYIDTVTAATVTKEIVTRWRNGDIGGDIPLLFNQVYALAGYGLSVYPGAPGSIVPIGAKSEETCTPEDAIARVAIVEQVKGLPSQGSGSFLTVAIRTLLLAALQDVPEPYRSVLLGLVEKVF